MDGEEKCSETTSTMIVYLWTQVSGVQFPVNSGTVIHFPQNRQNPVTNPNEKSPDLSHSVDCCLQIKKS